MPEGLISASFNEVIRMKRFLSCFKYGREIPGINLQVSHAFTWERGHLPCLFSTSQTLDYRVSMSKNIQANPYGFILDNKKGPLNKGAKFHCNTCN